MESETEYSETSFFFLFVTACTYAFMCKSNERRSYETHSTKEEELV
jgi:hypothetical protein